MREQDLAGTKTLFESYSIKFNTEFDAFFWREKGAVLIDSSREQKSFVGDRSYFKSWHLGRKCDQ